MRIAEERGEKEQIFTAADLSIETSAKLEQRQSSPCSASEPSVGRITPVSNFSSVDFPAPFMPMMPRQRPDGTQR